VRWNIGQHLFPLLTSLEETASVANERILVIIVDTQAIPAKTRERGSISQAELKHQISEFKGLLPHLYIQGFAAPELDLETRNKSGYGEFQWIINLLHDVEEWDSVVLTDADNTYSRYFLQQTAGARRDGHALIGVDFISHKPWNGAPNNVKSNTLEKVSSDLGSLIFHRGALDRNPVNKTCSCGVDIKAASVRHGWEAADAGLMELALECGGGAKHVVHQALFHQQ